MTLKIQTHHQPTLPSLAKKCQKSMEMYFMLRFVFSVSLTFIKFATCMCVCLFPSTVEAFPDWNKTVNGTFKLATAQECQLNRAEPREIKGNS